MEIKESSNTQTNADLLTKSELNSELIEVTPLEETPFAIVKTELGYMGVIGNHRITEIFKTKEECERELKDINWNRVMQVIWAVVEKFTIFEKININDLK